VSMGGPWVVFKGTKFIKDEGLPATVAIKRFRTTFTDEQCKRIRGDLKSKFKFTLRHKNLVSLLGECPFSVLVVLVNKFGNCMYYYHACLLITTMPISPFFLIGLVISLLSLAM